MQAYHHRIPANGRSVLWGEDYVEYREIGVEAVGQGVGLAISIGAYPKPYWSLDPNEDAVAAVIGERATLLVCADGHNGFDSVRPAVESILAQLGEDPPPPGSVDPVAVYVRANAETLAVTQEFEDARSQSRTTLAFALIAGNRVQWGAMGDAPVYLAEPNRVRTKIRDEHYFVGYRMEDRTVEARMHHGLEELSGGSWVVLASDGFSDYAGKARGAVAVADAVTEATEPAELAETLIQRAFDGHAGDNVAVAVGRVGA